MKNDALKIMNNFIDSFSVPGEYLPYRPWDGSLSQVWNNHQESEILKEPDKVLVRLEIPGYQSSDVQVELSKGILKVSGKKEEKSKFLTQKMSFAHTFVVGEDVLPEQTLAEVKDGVLTVTIPRKVPEPPVLPPVHKVEVK